MPGRLANVIVAAGALASLVLGASPAAARQRPPLYLTVTGSLTVGWRADPARGCAAAGQCGVTGTLRVVPAGSDGGQASWGARNPQVEIDDLQAAARVIHRGAGGAIESTCADVVPVGVTLSFRHVAGRTLGAIPRQLAFQPLSSGRCAGPTVADLSKLVLPARRSARGYDLAGTSTFGAGPFTVTSDSSLRVRASASPGATPGGLGLIYLLNIVGATSGTRPEGPAVRSRVVLQEQAEYEYRVTGIDGALATSFAGLPSPLCDGLGACGTSGHLVESLTGGGTAVFRGTRIVSHRVRPAAALADLRAGRMGIYDSLGALPLDESVSEVLTGPAGTCTDRAAERAPLDESGFHHGVERLLVAPASPSPFAGEVDNADPLRTRCPGPSLQDVLAGRGRLAAGAIATGRLGAKRLRIVLRGRGVFTGSSYAGDRSGAIALTLALVRASAGTRRVRLPEDGPGSGALVRILESGTR